MAKPITHIDRPAPDPAAQEAQALVELMGAVAQHKDALIAFVDIVGELQAAGLLDLARGLLKNRKQVGVLGINQMNKSGAQRILKNGISLLQFAAELDPVRMKQLLGAVAHGVERAEPSEKKVGMWGLVQTLGDPDVSTSISVVMNFLRGMGEGLPQKQQQQH